MSTQKQKRFRTCCGHHINHNPAETNFVPEVSSQDLYPDPICKILRNYSFPLTSPPSPSVVQDQLGCGIPPNILDHKIPSPDHLVTNYKSINFQNSSARILVLILLVSVMCDVATSCGPGTGAPGTAGRRTGPQKVVALPKWSRVPSQTELSYGASGPSEGAINRDSERFHNLVINENEAIEFESDDARRMTQRCKIYLNILAGWANSRWGHNKVLRVLSAWKPRPVGSVADHNVLHFEGRALDITVNNKLSKSKHPKEQDAERLGMIAALAVKVGFDFVHHQREYIHCSCLSDDVAEILPRGCFSGKSRVALSNGFSSPVSDLKRGDRVIGFDDNGRLREDIFLEFIDSEKIGRFDLIRIITEDGNHLEVTPNHLIGIGDGDDVIKMQYASRAIAGRFLYRSSNTGNLFSTRIINVTNITSTSGVFAPITWGGTIVIDDVAASCYASMECHTCAHYVTLPFRLFHYSKYLMFGSDDDKKTSSVGSWGVSRFAVILHHLATWILPEHLYWPCEI